VPQVCLAEWAVLMVSGYSPARAFYGIAVSEKVILEDDKNVFFPYIGRNVAEPSGREVAPPT